MAKIERLLNGNTRLSDDAIDVLEGLGEGFGLYIPSKEYLTNVLTLFAIIDLIDYSSVSSFNFNDTYDLEDEGISHFLYYDNNSIFKGFRVEEVIDGEEPEGLTFFIPLEKAVDTQFLEDSGNYIQCGVEELQLLLELSHIPMSDEKIKRIKLNYSSSEETLYMSIKRGKVKVRRKPPKNAKETTLFYREKEILLRIR